MEIFSNFKIWICIIVILVLCFCLCLFLCYRSNQNNIIYYKKCKREDDTQQTISSDLMNDLKIKKTTSENYHLYLPCGYTFAESELIGISGKIKNKFIYAIDGCDNLASKSEIWNILVSHYGRQKSSQIMPETFLLSDENEITQKLIPQFMYGQVPPLFILKKNIQRKEGLKITQDPNDIINAHRDGFVVAQKYITDVFTINKHKLNLRVYVLIMCKHGKKHVYLYQNGKCIYTNKEYNKNVIDMETQITSYNMNTSLYNSLPIDFYELEKTIGKHKWDTIFQKIKTKIYSLVKVFGESVCVNRTLTHSNVCFQLFGVDVILTDDLQQPEPYILEFNKGPDMKFANQKDYQMKYNLQRDVYQTVGLLQQIEKTEKTENGFVHLGIF